MIATLTASTMTIRRAVPEDIPVLLEMVWEFLTTHEMYQNALSPDRDRLRLALEHFISGNDTAVFVSDLNGQVTGLIAVFVWTHLFSGERWVAEVVWWGDPAHRGHGLRLLRRAEQWAREMGATRMQMIAPESELGTLYERLGYRVMETSYLKVLS